MFVHEDLLQSTNVFFFSHFKNQTLLLLFHHHYVVFMFIILTQICKILRYLYRNICTFIVIYFIAVCFEDILVSAPCKWRHNNAETFSSSVKHCKHNL